jgi:hypothetical protein
MGAGGRALLLREAGASDMAALERRLSDTAARADAIIRHALGTETEHA